jgi:hypothetical protein
LAAALFAQIKHALQTLQPAQVRAEAQREVRIGLIGSSAEVLGEMEAFLAPRRLSPERRAEALRSLSRGGGNGCDIVLCESSLLAPAFAFAFDRNRPESCVGVILKQRPGLLLPLARRFYPFRKQASYKIIREVARENALFCLATALPDVVPSLLSLPWAIGEYGSDAAFLTANQIRMAFLLAAASDQDVGYREQRAEIASITASCFGWRALARELAGKIPFGGGLIPKAAIAWAGTFAVGSSLERLYRLGYGFTRAERATVYQDALRHGKEVSRMLLADLLRQRKTA